MLEEPWSKEKDAVMGPRHKSRPEPGLVHSDSVSDSVTLGYGSSP